MIRTSVNRSALAEQFAEGGIVVVRDWLEPAYAEGLWAHLDGMRRDDWFVSARPAADGPMIIARWTDERRGTIDRNVEIAREAFARGEFAYVFRRTNDDHADECRCGECVLRRDLQSSEAREFLRVVTGHRVEDLHDFFASWYHHGDFLGPHTDASNGVLGFVYNLSRSWRPQYGGNLHFLDAETESQIERVLVPSFNTLTLFDLARCPPHFVSQVVSGTAAKRLAFTGWWMGEGA